MLIEITEKVEQKRTVDITFPYYYEHDLLLDECDSIIYGKIEENKHTTIQITDRYAFAQSAEIEVRKRPAKTLGCYMTPEYTSDESVFIDAKDRALKLLNEA